MPRQPTKRRNLPNMRKNVKRTRHGATRSLRNLSSDTLSQTRNRVISRGVRRHHNGPNVGMKLRRHFRLLISTLTSKPLTRTMTTNSMRHHRRKLPMNRRVGNRKHSNHHNARQVRLNKIHRRSNRRSSTLRGVGRTR